MQTHPVYTLKLRGNGIERTVFLEYGRERVKKDAVANLKDLCRYIVKNFGARRHRLTYIGKNDRASYILDEDSLRNAVHSAYQGVLYVKVTPVEMVTATLGDQNASQLERRKKKTIETRMIGSALLSRRFSVHNFQCSSCKTSPIRGTRYMFKNNTRHNLCQNCVEKHNKTDWFPIHFPWKSSVPKSPLGVDGSKVRDSVRHLQKVLTELGYLKFKDTRLVQGIYDVYTKKAVESFRLRYEIEGGNMNVYNRNTELTLAEALRLKSL